MKNKWLDNFNDSEASLSSNFIGEGYTSIGSNSNSAWGGQFQTGGNLSPLMTRRDSLDLQKYSQKKNKEMEKRGFVLQTKEQGSYSDVHSLNLSKLKELNHRKQQNKVTQVINEKGYREPKVYDPNIYQRPLSNDKYFNQETDIGVLDPASSYMLFDRRANPTEKQVWMNPHTGDGATTYGYDFGEKYNPIPNKPRITPPKNKKPSNSLTALNQPINYMQNGGEMKYYQNGLDWKPKSISKDGNIIKDDNGYWNPDNWGKEVEINSPIITMENVYEPLIGTSKETGEQKLMLPGQNYKFKNTKKVIETPLSKKAKEGMNIDKQLDQLTNFTNYNKPTRGGWLDSYK